MHIDCDLISEVNISHYSISDTFPSVVFIYINRFMYI